MVVYLKIPYHLAACFVTFIEHYSPLAKYALLPVLFDRVTSLRRSKNYLGALYRRTASRKGKIRAGIVVAHAMLRIAYYLLTRKEMYVDLGEDYFDKQRQQSIVRHSLRRLKSLGYTVTLQEPEAS